MTRLLPVALISVWICWALPFVLRLVRGERRRAATAHISIFGILLQSLAYGLVWSAGRFAPGQLAPWRIVLFVLFAIPALVLIWTAIPALGKQWRLEAGVNVDHELVQTGPYRFLRHPIYASMLALLLSTAALITMPRAFAIAIVLFIAGTEIRIRAEDRVLAEHFGKQFENYRQRVPAYIPWIR